MDRFEPKGKFSTNTAGCHKISSHDLNTVQQELDSSNREDMKMKQMKEEPWQELIRLRRENLELKVLGHQRTTQERIDSLHELSLELLQDQDFALSFVRNNSVGWHDLPTHWQENPKVICAIFDSKTEAPKKTPDETRFRFLMEDDCKLKWSDLPYSLKMNKDVTKHALRVQGCGLRWDDVHVQFHDDVDLLVTAVLYEKISSYADDVPQCLQQNHKEVAFFGVQRNYVDVDGCPCLKDDREFWKHAMEEGRANWRQLPSGLKTDVNFARSISCCTETELPKQMLEHLVDLRGDQSFWRQMMTLQRLKDEKGWQHRFTELVREFAPVTLLSDFAFMLEMCKQCAPLFTLVGDGLAGNRDFLEEALSGNVEVLSYVPLRSQEMHRDLVMKTIPHLAEVSKDVVKYRIAKSLSSSFWSDNDFATTWVKTGLGYPSHLFEQQLLDAWENDRDLALANVVHGKSFQHVPQRFREDIPFMAEVVEHHPMFFLEGCVRGPRVWITAMAGSMELTEQLIVSGLHFKGRDDAISKTLDFLRHQLEPFETFSSCILGNMLSTQSVQGTGTNLTLLNQGPETCHMYKKLLAAYLGVPTGKWLDCLQKAERNVLEIIAPFWEEKDEAKY